MVPLQGFSLEEQDDHNSEYGQGNGLLDDFELNQAERTPVDAGADPVGRDHHEILEKGDAPGKEDDDDQRPAVRDVHFRQLEMPVPGKRHEDV